MFEDLYRAQGQGGGKETDIQSFFKKGNSKSTVQQDCNLQDILEAVSDSRQAL